MREQHKFGLAARPGVRLLQEMRVAKESEWTTAHCYMSVHTKTEPKESGVVIGVPNDILKKWSMKVIQASRRSIAIELTHKEWGCIDDVNNDDCYDCETRFTCTGLPPSERYTWQAHLFATLVRRTLDYVFIDTRNKDRHARTHIRSVPALPSDHKAVGLTIALNTNEWNAAARYARKQPKPIR